MNENKPIIAERIKKLRKEKGLTQEQLAEILGLNAKSSIANYESGANSPSDDIKKKMCELFDCSIDYLMGKSKFKTKEDEFSNYMKQQNKILILKTLDRYHSEYIVTCSLKEDDIDFMVNTLSDVNAQNVKEIKNKIDSYVSSFEKNISKKIRTLINIIVSELIDDLKNKDMFYYYTSLIDKKNKNSTTTLPPYYMCPVYGQISAGQPNWAEENIEGRIPIDTNLMDIVNPEEHFFLRVNR